jgi:hypothetical protein
MRKWNRPEQGQESTLTIYFANDNHALEGRAALVPWGKDSAEDLINIQYQTQSNHTIHADPRSAGRESSRCDT